MISENGSRQMRRPNRLIMHLFRFGNIVSTPGALDLLRDNRFCVADLLSRHGSGDWGDVSANDAIENEHSLESGDRLFSVYRLVSPEKLNATLPEARADLPTVLVITEGDKSSTCILLPSEY